MRMRIAFPSATGQMYEGKQKKEQGNEGDDAGKLERRAPV